MDVAFNGVDYSVRQFGVTVGVGLAQILPQSKDRVMVFFQNRGAAAVLIKADIDASLADAINMTAGDPPLLFNQREHGRLPSQPWSTIATGAATLIVIEVIFNPAP